MAAFLSTLAIGCTPDDEPGFEVGSSDAGESGGDADDEVDDGPEIICEPGELRCGDTTTIEACAPTGLKWEPSPCGEYQECEECFDHEDGDCIVACVGPCERVNEEQSSAGCSFYTAGTHPGEEIVVVNPDPERMATVALHLVPPGTNVEELADGPIELWPGESHAFEISADQSFIDSWSSPSKHRSGGVRHVVSNLPVVARRHSPPGHGGLSGASLLLPEHMLTGDYVVYGYPPHWYFNTYFDKVITDPNYFTIIALDDQTTVRWWPTAATAGDGLPLPFVEAGGMGQQLLNRFDNIRIASSSKFDAPNCQQDLSGTVIVSNKPIWVESAVRSAGVPFCPGDGCENPHYPAATCPHSIIFSDFMIEQNIPLEYWGTEYVAPHPPLRGDEDHHWRIYAGADNLTVTVEPPQPEMPLTFAKRGDWAELVVPAGTNLHLSGDGAFMPVQYLASRVYPGMDDIGEPAMVQLTPTAQWARRYVLTAPSFHDNPNAPLVGPLHYVQVVRAATGAEVRLDGSTIEAWEPFGDWRIATVEIDEGAHVLESSDTFGAVQYGYSAADMGSYNNKAGYAYPVGMRAQPLFVP